MIRIRRVQDHIVGVKRREKGEDAWRCPQHLVASSGPSSRHEEEGIGMKSTKSMVKIFNFPLDVISVLDTLFESATANNANSEKPSVKIIIYQKRNDEYLLVLV